MFAYIGNSRDELERLVGGLENAARVDKVAVKLGMKHTTHQDGWGFAIYSDRGISFYKSEKPIFDDEKVLPPTAGKIYAIYHARQASKGYAVRRRFSHPFLGETDENYVFLTHNGTLDGQKLAEELNFHGDALDSELALKYALQNDSLGQAVTDLQEYTMPNSALNLLILQISKDGGAEVFVKHYYKKDRAMLDKTEYYSILSESLAEGKAVFSSTLNYYGFSGKELARDDLVPLSAV